MAPKMIPRTPSNFPASKRCINMRSMRNGFSFTSSRKRILPAVSISHGVPSEATTTERHPPVIGACASPASSGCTFDSELDPAGKEKSNASPRSAARNENLSARPVAKSLATIGPWKHTMPARSSASSSEVLSLYPTNAFGVRLQCLEVEQRQQVIRTVAAASADDRIHVVALPHLHQSGSARYGRSGKVALALQCNGRGLDLPAAQRAQRTSSLPAGPMLQRSSQG